MERTFVALKPDAVKRALIGEVIKRFENRNYKIVALKMLQPTLEIAEKHYAEHIGKHFYQDLIKYITSGPIIAMVLEGSDVIAGVRHLVGATDPNQADVGTIRADFGQIRNRNIVHASDSKESAEREIAIYFSEKEFCSNWSTIIETLV